MVYYSSTVSDSVSDLVDQLTAMSAYPANPVHRNRRSTPSTSPPCPRGWSQSAAVDFITLLTVVGACGFLLFPYAKILSVRSVGVIVTIASVIGQEFREAPLVYASMGMSVLCAGVAIWAVLVSGSFPGRKCSNPECRGLRKSVEFDIRLETDEDSRKEGSARGRNLFELTMHQHKGLEAELKKMAPPNGRAVLVFRGRCGCPVGRFEVPGPKRFGRGKTKR